MTQRVPISDSGAPDGIAVRAPMVAVGPVGQIKVEDVGLGAAQFDAWVRYVSGGLVGLESLQSVTTCAPVMGNLIAVVGALGNIAGLSEMPTHKPLDWVDLAINLIGLLPTPENQAHARLSLRPALFLVRQEMQQSGASGNAKGALGDGQVALLMGHLNATIKGELSNFIERAQGYLPAMLQQGGQVGCDLTLALAAGLEQAAALPPMASITQDIATRILNDSQATIDNVFKATWDVYKAAGCPESHAEAFAPLTPHEAQQALALTVAGLRRFATTIPPALQDLANPDMPGGPGWLLTTLLEAVASWRTRHGTGQSVNIKSDATTQAVRIASEGELGAVSFEEIARGDCSSCGEPVKADTDHSISFARGTERLSQTDWALPGPFPFSWTRTYRSNLGQFMWGTLDYSLYHPRGYCPSWRRSPWAALPRDRWA